MKNLLMTLALSLTALCSTPAAAQGCLNCTSAQAFFYAGSSEKTVENACARALDPDLLELYAKPEREFCQRRSDARLAESRAAKIQAVRNLTSADHELITEAQRRPKEDK